MDFIIGSLLGALRFVIETDAMSVTFLVKSVSATIQSLAAVALPLPIHVPGHAGDDILGRPGYFGALQRPYLP